MLVVKVLSTPLMPAEPNLCILSQLKLCLHSVCTHDMYQLTILLESPLVAHHDVGSITK